MPKQTPHRDRIFGSASQPESLSEQPSSPAKEKSPVSGAWSATGSLDMTDAEVDRLLHALFNDLDPLPSTEGHSTPDAATPTDKMEGTFTSLLARIQKELDTLMFEGEPPKAPEVTYAQGCVDLTISRQRYDHSRGITYVVYALRSKQPPLRIGTYATKEEAEARSKEYRQRVVQILADSKEFGTLHDLCATL